jgi:hypothetical protein
LNTGLLLQGAAMGLRQRFSEMIGRVAFNTMRVITHLSFDWSQVDHKFWSALRRGKQRTYELGALFSKPITEIIAAWTLGKGINTQTDSEAVNDALSDFLNEHLQLLVSEYENSMGLGNAYIVVNPDATLTAVPPDQVEVLTEPPGSASVVGYRITTQLQDRRIIDEYRLDERVLTVKKGSGEPVVTRYRNLLGVLPVIHIPNDRETNEIYGHPIYEALLPLFGRYDNALTKSLDAIEVMGNPIPVAEGLDDPAEAQRVNATGEEQWVDADGQHQTRPVIDFSQLPMLFLGKGGSFKFAAPGNFAGDSVALLKKLFYLMLEHIQIPEWAWGGAIASSKASVDAQMPAFALYIEGRRRKLERPLRQVMTAWLRTMGLFTPGLRGDAEIRIEWSPLVGDDQSLRLQTIKLALAQGLITDETALRLLDLVDDPAVEVQKVAQAQETRAASEAARFDADMDQAMRELDAAA